MLAARELARRLVRQHEAVRSFPYDDKTGRTLRPGDRLVGKLTIGIGRNLTDRPLSPAAIAFLNDEDLEIAIADLDRLVPGWRDHDPVRAGCLIDLSFNLGGARLAKFGPTLAAFARRDYLEVGRRLRRTLWAKQTKTRADRIIRMIETGEVPAEIAGGK